ncbi:polyprenyl synthetase family protein [Streptomyces sp. NPDC047197]|uniref:polyprenyl synthetase family protein n=1 Tax=Streptomyces sp. NPDC047197 TaxID=3155477 RepID=UPI00340BA142
MVSADVAAAVGRVLDEVFQERLDAAASIDARFAQGVAEMVADFTLTGGKRMRSRFLWWGMQACGGPADGASLQAALRLAAGLELIQTCALVHDDVMDGSPVRRGRAAMHMELAAQHGAPATGPGASFGTSAAILIGDLALAWADDVVAATEFSPDLARDVRRLWQAMRSEMVAGQYLDLYGQRTGSRSMSLALQTASLKSGLYSVERPLAFGAALAGADQRTTRALCSAGRCAGLAFQLRDDLLGVFGDPGHTGKPAGDDIKEGKLTYLLAVARARAQATRSRALLRILDTHVGDAGLTEREMERVRGALVASGARDTVEAKIRRLLAQSVRHLDRVALEPAAVAHLRELFCTAAGIPSTAAADIATGSSDAPGDGHRASPLPPFAEASNV